MKIDRSELESKLIEKLNSIKSSKKTCEKIIKILNKHKLTGALFYDITANNNKIGDLSFEELFVLTSATNEVVGGFPVTEYYTDSEIDKCKSYKAEINKGMGLPITLKDVVSLDSENFLTKIKITQLVEMYHAGLIEYDFETQRTPKFKRSKDSVFMSPHVNPKSVKEIKKHVQEGTYQPDVITLNVNSEEVEPISYDDKTKELTINDGATISILDGFHRLRAMVEVVSDDPNTEFTLGLAVKVYSTERAKAYFGQINTINPVSKARLQELKLEKESDNVVKELQFKSVLKGRISSGSHVSTVAKHLTTFSILSEAIDDVYNPKTFIEKNETIKYLTEFFEYLLGYFPEQFETKVEHYRKISYINAPNTFYGYIALSKRMKDENIPLDKIKDIIESIDFSKDNEDSKLNKILNELGSKSSNRIRKQIKKFFNDIEVAV